MTRIAMHLTTAVALTATILTASVAQAQIVTPQPSPKSTVMQRVGLTDVTITYSRPSLKNREVFGANSPLAPYGLSLIHI